MTRIGQLLLDEGLEQGMELTQSLLDRHRPEDMKRTFKDEAYRKKLLEELNSQG